MEYRIVLTRMEFHALHGCYELERKVGNRFTVDLELTAELGHAATDDDVRKTVNYLTAYEVVEMQMRITQHTIERVATNIIEAIYATFPQVRHVKCTVSKLAPPLGGKLEKVSVVQEKNGGRADAWTQKFTIINRLGYASQGESRHLGWQIERCAGRRGKFRGAG